MWNRLWAYIRSREGSLFILGVFGVGILGYVFFLMVLLPWLTRQGEEYVLPSLIGRDYQKVMTALEEAGFSVMVIDSQYVPDQAPHTILLQDPPAGTHVKKGRPIYVTITSARPPTVPFPHIKDMPYEEAHRLLRETYGFRIGNVEYRSGSIPDVVLGALYEGKAISAGTPVPKYSTIDLIVSRGLGEEKVSFVSVVGMPLEEAVSRLHAAGLAVGQIRYKPTPNIAPGYVYRQYPEKMPDDMAPAGMPVDLVVNSAPPASVSE